MTDYHEQSGEARIREVVPGLKQMTVSHMSLRAIFISHALHYRRDREVQK